jgi:hypothetical protein
LGSKQNRQDMRLEQYHQNRLEQVPHSQKGNQHLLMKQQEREDRHQKAVRTERMQQMAPSAQKSLMGHLGQMKFQVPAGGKSIRQVNCRSHEHTAENTQELKPEIMLGK